MVGRKQSSTPLRVDMIMHKEGRVKPKIFLDMDGVFVDIMRGIENYFGVFLDHASYSQDFYKKLGMHREDFWSGLSTEFWATLPKTEDADLILALVEPYKPMILTAHPGFGIAQCVAGKVQWLEMHLLDYLQEDRVVFSGRDKSFLANPGVILIDDHDTTITDWNKAGGDGILVPRPWNGTHGCDPIYTIQSQLMTLLGDEY